MEVFKSKWQAHHYETPFLYLLLVEGHISAYQNRRNTLVRSSQLNLVIERHTISIR
jgi:hypothetical protein